MNDRIKKMLDDILEKKHHQYRQQISPQELTDFTEMLCKKGYSDTRRAMERLSWVLSNEKPIILPSETIVFTKTITKAPELFTPEEWTLIKKSHYIHELGRVSNISSNYEYTIEVGLEHRKNEIIEAMLKFSDDKKSKELEFLDAVLQSIIDVEKIVARYAQEARDLGRMDIYNMLQQIPSQGATSFHEALQFFRILHFTLWASGNYHNTVGRFDQYMFKYLDNDLKKGVLTEESAFELLEEFFLSFNKDSDLYVGMQQGDNGQSMVLGGVDKDGNSVFNKLSEMCMKASLELKLIDPKINLRVDKNTPKELYELGTELTKQGLGFPQYSNDDVVIPGLVSKGYSLEDARTYVVAACWEFIIPHKGMDIPNITALSFTKLINKCIDKYLAECNTFEAFMKYVQSEMTAELVEITCHLDNIYFEPAPFQSLLMDDCIQTGKDISLGNKYNNYGIHGTGISTAVDSLAAVKKFVFKTKEVSAGQLIEGIKTNFENDEILWLKLKHDAPKMGNDDEFVDDIAVDLMDMFANLSKGMRNEHGGIYRPGTGSAMYYIWHANEVGASADGRKKGEPLSANFSPSLNTKMNGPISIIRSFSKPDMRRIMNGGPLTLELHDTIFRNAESISKVAALVKSFMDMGGQQLQINAVNREQLIEAKKHPENHKNLIVRVWGWSGYFVELDEVYQDQIIQRIELEV